MEEENIDVIAEVSEAMERATNETLKAVTEQWGPEVAINVLINVSTSMLAKALIMNDPGHRDVVEEVAMRFVRMKVKEGHAAVESMIAISKAMVPKAGSNTCQAPKKH